jgi:hypothetical protein
MIFFDEFFLPSPRPSAYIQGLNCQKISWGVDICLFIVIVITHRRLSIINNGGAGLKLTPPGYPRASCLRRLSKQLGCSTPQPPRQFKHCLYLASFLSERFFTATAVLLLGFSDLESAPLRSSKVTADGIPELI